MTSHSEFNTYVNEWEYENRWNGDWDVKENLIFNQNTRKLQKARITRIFLFYQGTNRTIAIRWLERETRRTDQTETATQVGFANVAKRQEEFARRFEIHKE